MAFIRDEAPADAGARELLLDRCFGPRRRAKTSEKLRRGRLPAEGLALAAEDHDGRLVGTLRLWHVDAGRGCPALLLGPLAVAPDLQGEGLGSRLMREALLRAREFGHQAVLLVGDAPYYARFGFQPELTKGLWLPGPVEAGRFLAHEIVPGALAGVHGLVTATGQKIKPLARAA
ncbi:N-acetyltransferase [Agaricicola taiwanensis]|uniref:N-acetyltransferase n=1 Tax=Agaricicola taiwanensis TaxID=591372 RepID=A0A8J2YMG8_9RHOB|nr:N-acetyltransferase [Agaricicola taiwanensis]GGE53221.1 N-acetyltransferase [Agaricicola taiwanensis]